MAFSQPSLPQVSIPYTGLRPFYRHEKLIFFGRDNYSRDVLRRLTQKEQFIAIIGPSGSGKSSLIKAGVLPDLVLGMLPDKGSEWVLVEMRPSGRPYAELATTLHKSLSADQSVEELEATLRQGANALYAWLESIDLSKDKKILLLVDQFEELFRIYTPQADVRSFIQFILKICQSSNIFVILTMRSEFIENCGEYSGLLNAINNGIYILPQLTQEELRDAIVKPLGLRCFDDAIEDSLVDKLLDEAQKAGAACLPLLQHTLLYLWQIAHSTPKNIQGEFVLKWPNELPVYNSKSLLSDFLEQYLEELYHKLDYTTQKIVQIIFRSLTESKDGYSTRRPQTIKALINLTGPLPEHIMWCIEPFRHNPPILMPPKIHREREEDFLDDDVIDLAHEVVIYYWKRLKGWVETEAKAANFYRDLQKQAKDWKDTQNDPSFLWRGTQLTRATDWQQQLTDYLCWEGDASPERRQQALQTWLKRYAEDVESVFLLITQFLEVSEQTEQEEIQQEQLKQQREEKQRLLKQREEKRQEFIQLGAIAGIMLLLLSIGLLSDWYEASQQQLQQQRQTQFETKLSEARHQIVAENYQGATAILDETDTLDKYISVPTRNVRNTFTWIADLMGDTRTQPYSQLDVNFYTLAVSPHSQRLAIGGADNSVWLLQTPGGQPIPLTKNDGAPATVWEIAFHPQDQWLAAAGDDSQVRLWQPPFTPSSEPFSHWEIGYAIQALTVSTDGMHLATGGEDGQIDLWNSAGTRVVRLTDEKKQPAIAALAFHPKKQQLVSASDKTLSLWDLSTKEVVQVMKGHADKPEAVAFSADGGVLASGDGNGDILLWNTVSGEIIQQLRGHQNRVTTLTFCEKDKDSWLISGSIDKTVRVWDVPGRVLLQVLQGHSDRVTAVAAKGEAIYSVTENGEVMRWTTDLSEQKHVAIGADAAAVVVDGEHVIVGFDDGWLRSYALQNHQVTQSIQAHQGPVIKLALNHDGKRLVSVGSDEKAVIWPIQDGKLLVDAKKTYNQAVSAAAFSPSNLNNTLALAGDGYISLYPSQGESRQITMPQDDKKINAMAFDHKSEYLLTVSDKTVRIWPIQEPNLKSRKVRDIQSEVFSVAFSPDNQHILTTGRNPPAVHVYSFPEGKLEYKLNGHQDTVIDAVFTPDSGQVISVSADATLRFWELQKGTQLFSLRLPTRPYPPVPLWDFDFGCTGSVCRIAVPLTRGELVVYEMNGVYEMAENNL